MKQTCEVCGGEYDKGYRTKTCGVECGNVLRSQAAKKDWEDDDGERSELIRRAMQRDDVRAKLGKNVGKRNGMYGMTGDKNPAYRGKVEHTCEYCSRTFEDYPSRERRFCSSQCRAEWMSDECSGNRSWNWKGGIDFYYGEKWNAKLRERVRERDGHECQECGVCQDDLDVKLHVHHHLPVRVFADPNDAHYMKNLSSLCPSCHPRVEKMFWESDLNLPIVTSDVFKSEAYA